MYRYDEFDQQLVNERVAQFRGQVARRLSGEITEDEMHRGLTRIQEMTDKVSAQIDELLTEKEKEILEF